MRLKNLLVIAVTLLTFSIAQADPAKSDPNVVQWNAHSDFADGRRFLTDGAMLLESRIVPGVSVPEKQIPAANVQRLLQSSTDRQFGLGDLEQKDSGHYTAPGPILLNRKYVDLLRGSPLKSSLRLGAKGPNDPILILEGEKVVGVMMPMKS